MLKTAEPPPLRIETPVVFAPLLQPSRYKGLYGGRGGAKCLGRGTLVVRFDGSLAPVESIVAGDVLMGPDSTARNVLVTTHGRGLLYQITQKTAMSYVVNDAHILALQRSRTSKEDFGSFSAAGNPQRVCGRYARYGVDVTLISAADYASQTARFKNHVFGYKTELKFLPQAVEIDPYILGLWLGDGDTDRVGFTTMDLEIVEAIQQFAFDYGFSVSARTKPNNKASSYQLSNSYKREGSPLNVWRGLDLLGNKHIPEHYIVNDTQIRLELLAGLIDTDGYCHNGSLSISQKSERLIDDIKRLADSLGFKTSKRKKNAKCKGKTYPQFYLSIGGDINRVPCRIARKKVACLSVQKNKNWRYTRIDVEPIGEGDYYGFALDGDQLFVLSDGTVTHNSHQFAELMLERHLMKSTRSVCVREVQQSLEQSVKRLLSDKIQALGLGKKFNVKHAWIETPGDGLIVFRGMKDATAESIKSLEGFNIAWIEEAQSVSQRSLDLLRPTIREPHSEVWASWNPRYPTDPIDVLLRGKDTPPDSIILPTSFRDNPWFPDVLRAEMEYDRRRDPEKYQHVWNGAYLTNSEARVFKNWTVEEFETPADTLFYFGGDWGYSVDPTVLIRLFAKSAEGAGRGKIYIDQEAYQIGCEIDHTPALFDSLVCKCQRGFPCDHPQHGMARKWEIIADSARPETISYLQRNNYPRIQPAIKGANSVKEGVIFLQGYDIIIHPRCKHTIDEFTYYSYKTDSLTGVVTPILEDRKNHVIDSCRYAVEKIRKPKEWLTW